MKVTWQRFFYSFPVQLLVYHLRSNLTLLLLWFTLLLLITGHLGRELGIHYLFLDPEYLGRVNFTSFWLIGLAFGGYLMTWNLTTYLLSAYYFPFLASLSRPFAKFCLNNALLPLLFAGVYLVTLVKFQRFDEYWPVVVIMANCLGFLSGIVVVIMGYFAYFYFTNKDIFSYLKRHKDPPPDQVRVFAPGRRGVDLEYIRLDSSRWRVDTYLNERLRPRLVRSVAHYDTSLLLRIFKQNHLNALVVQLVFLLVLLSLSVLIDRPLFRIPAGASIFVFASVLVAIAGAISYWFHEWRFIITIVLLIFINFLTRYNWFNHENKAYGLDYRKPPATYSLETMESVCLSEQVPKDELATIKILDRWKQRRLPEQRPPLIIICTSGGGLKAATWTMNVLQKADQQLQGELFENTVLISGASGGMIGAAYYRELVLRSQTGDTLNPDNHMYMEDMAKDLLNSVAFTIVTNDLFLPWSTFESGGFQYHKDRGYIFERQLNENTRGILDKPLEAYREPEQEALIPMLLLSPSVVNDARRMLISPQGISYLMVSPIGTRNPGLVEVDGVDFGWLLREQNADNLSFLSALRMNATFPYILPNVYLPTSPGIELVDAGFRDNYGFLSAVRFVQVFKDWIQENTGGVVFLQISANEKIEEIDPSDRQGAIESILNPLGIAGRVVALQEFEHDNLVGLTEDLLGADRFELIRFVYTPVKKEKKASISFHITDREKNDVLEAWNQEFNRKSMEKLEKILRQGK